MEKSNRIEKARVAALETFETKRAEIPQYLEAGTGSEDHGIRNLLELLVLVEALVVTAIDVLRDGLSPLDVLDVFRAKDLREAIPDAFEGIGKVDDEALDLSVDEVFTLLRRASVMAQNVVVTVVKGSN